MKSATIRSALLSFIIALIVTGCNSGTSNGGPPPQNNPPAQATVSGHAAVYTGQPNPFVCQATDPEGQAIRYEFDWNGDALPDEESEEVSSSARVSTTHTFETAGAYTAQCRGKDGSGAAGDWSNAISVIVSESPGAETSPFGVFGTFEYQLDDPTVATDEQIIGYLTDIGVPWVQEMYFTSANVFNMYGLIHNPRNDGLSHKKLAYYTYKKMIEILDGSDWSVTQTIQETDNVYIYKLMKNGNSLYVAWWDYFNDATYTPGTTIQVSLSGLQGVSAVVTETVPKFATGMEVTDYATAFNTSTLAVSNGSAALDLGENPVIVEVLQ